ncbi:hypothetical protein [Winogradskyella sp. A2]|uniref:hypothetical protein n=1 Tax=Winogradskyella sp. A2 TaxID=3366944 RepID=UPI00398C2DBC
MKRIDEKIKEIEKKDNKNRFLFFVIIGLIAAFLITIGYYHKNLEKAEILASDAYIDLAKKDTILRQELEIKKLYIDSLENSLRPEDYWNYIKDENSVEGYIEYFTNIWGIRRDSVDLNSAQNNIKLTLKEESNENGLIGFEGWVYIGKETASGPFVHHDDGQVFKIVWRRGHEEENQISSIENTKPEKDDIIQLVRVRNRTTYEDASFDSDDNGEGWRPSSKAYVLEIKKNQIEVWVKIRYY